MVPKNPVAAMANARMLPIIVFSVLLGIAITMALAVFERTVEGRLVEVRVRGFFKTAEDAKSPRAGIRVFYYRNANGFIFLPYRTIKEVVVLGKLTKEQKEALETAVAASERAAARGRKKTVDGSTPKPELSGLTEKERELLTKFDPAKGWSAERSSSESKPATGRRGWRWDRYSPCRNWKS